MMLIEKDNLKRCNSCKFSEQSNFWSLLCNHPRVIKSDAFALSAQIGGAICQNERNNGFLSACGLTGKLWALKSVEEIK